MSFCGGRLRPRTRLGFGSCTTRSMGNHLHSDRGGEGIGTSLVAGDAGTVDSDCEAASIGCGGACRDGVPRSLSRRDPADAEAGAECVGVRAASNAWQAPHEAYEQEHGHVHVGALVRRVEGERRTVVEPDPIALSPGPRTWLLAHGLAREAARHGSAYPSRVAKALELAEQQARWAGSLNSRGYSILRCPSLSSSLALPGDDVSGVQAVQFLLAPSRVGAHMAVVTCTNASGELEKNACGSVGQRLGFGASRNWTEA